MEELEQYKNKIKKNIETLINSNNLEEAKNIIKEYEELVNNDVDIYSFKGVISIMEGQLDEAEKFLMEGLMVEYHNFDLVYNRAYLYQLEKDYIKAYEFYNRAKEYTKEEESKKKIQEILSEYNKIEEIKIYKRKLEEKNSISPKVTIIIPAYNQKKYLKQAIDSCIFQDYPNIEILVGDDCSTDGTEKMMENYLKYDCIRYIRNKNNLGAGKNTQYLLDNYVTGKYGMILNHDDYLIKNNYISEAVNLLMENPNLAFVWANCKIKNEISGQYSYTNFKNKTIIKGIDYFINYETTMYPHITGVLTTVFDIEKLKSTKFGYEKTKSRDVFLYLNLMLVGDVGFIDECVSVYRVHENSISFNMPIEFDQSTIKEFEKLKKYVLNKEIVNEKEMEIWINNRVYTYISWRFDTLWNNKSKKQALNLLMNISQKYPVVYEEILDNI